MIKIFRFRVSNRTLVCPQSDKKVYDYDEKVSEIASPEDIENKINTFLKDGNYRIVNMHVTPIDVHYHNNGRSNTIDLIYTIEYEPVN